MGGGWTIGKLLINSCGGLQCCSNNGARFGAATGWRCAKGAHIRASGNERCRESGRLLHPLGAERTLGIWADPFGRIASIGVTNEIEPFTVVR